MYIIAPFLLFMMAFVILPADRDKTTPYDFNTPKVLLPVINPADNPATVEGVELGRKLFYDPALSGNGKQSCASCHKQELAFTDGLNVSRGTRGLRARRNSMALVNLGWQDTYFWDGRAGTLEALIHFPVTDTLEMNADTLEIKKVLNADSEYRTMFRRAFGTDKISMSLTAQALSQFLRTIVSYNTPFDRIYRDYLYNGGETDVKTDRELLLNALLPGTENKYGHDPDLVKAIREVSPDEKVINAFSRCIKCHYNTLQPFTHPGNEPVLNGDQRVQFKNNGLDTSDMDRGRYQATGENRDRYLFKVPSLRNLTFTAPYMHDGRFKTLEQVVEHYNSGIKANPALDTLLMDGKKPIRFNLTADEKKQLVGMLLLFSDSSVIRDPRYAAPQPR